MQCIATFSQKGVFRDTLKNLFFKGDTLMSECTHDCSSCSNKCSDQKPESFLESPNKLSNINKVIGVVSGKGGVGKTLVSSMLAVTMQRLGKKVGILDADITGPSIPKA